MKKTLVILLMLCSTLAYTQSQNLLGIKANGGVSRISNSFNPPNSDWTVRFGPSGSAGLFYNLKCGKLSVMGAEVLFSQIEGREHYRLEYTGSDGNDKYSDANIYKSISYLSLPVYYGFRMSKLSLNIGLQGSYVLRSNGREKGERIIFNDVETFEHDYGGLNIDRFDYGARVGVSYDLRENLACEGTYYFGLNNIFISAISTNWVWRVHQATLGIKYAFGNRPKSE